MKYLIILMVIATSSNAFGLDFKDTELKCTINIDRHKITLIAEQLEVWNMSKANREIVLGQIVESLILECLEQEYK